MMTELEMEGFLRGKCVPGDMLVNESNAQYLVRKFNALEKQCDALAAESAALKNGLEWLYAAVSSESISIPDSNYSSVTNAAAVLSETPATDAYLAEVRAQARSEGIDYAASRLAAAFNHGFVDKPVKEVADVVRMILTAKEDLANDPLPAPDALSGEYAEQALDEWATELRKGGAA